MINGRAQSLPKPIYPPAATASRVTGPATVRVTINEEGYVIYAKMICGNSVFKEAVVSAASKARFSPTLLSGLPVKVTGLITYNFVP